MNANNHARRAIELRAKSEAFAELAQEFRERAHALAIEADDADEAAEQEAADLARIQFDQQ